MRRKKIMDLPPIPPPWDPAGKGTNWSWKHCKICSIIPQTVIKCTPPAARKLELSKTSVSHTWCRHSTFQLESYFHTLYFKHPGYENQAQRMTWCSQGNSRDTAGTGPGLLRGNPVLFHQTNLSLPSSFLQNWPGSVHETLAWDLV